MGKPQPSSRVAIPSEAKERVDAMQREMFDVARVIGQLQEVNGALQQGTETSRRRMIEKTAEVHDMMLVHAIFSEWHMAVRRSKETQCLKDADALRAARLLEIADLEQQIRLEEAALADAKMIRDDQLRRLTYAEACIRGAQIHMIAFDSAQHLNPRVSSSEAPQHLRDGLQGVVLELEKSQAPLSSTPNAQAPRRIMFPGSGEESPYAKASEMASPSCAAAAMSYPSSTLLAAPACAPPIALQSGQVSPLSPPPPKAIVRRTAPETILPLPGCAAASSPRPPAPPCGLVTPASCIGGPSPMANVSTRNSGRSASPPQAAWRTEPLASRPALAPGQLGALGAASARASSRGPVDVMAAAAQQPPRYSQPSQPPQGQQLPQGQRTGTPGLSFQFDGRWRPQMMSGLQPPSLQPPLTGRR